MTVTHSEVLDTWERIGAKPGPSYRHVYANIIRPMSIPMRVEDMTPEAVTTERVEFEWVPIGIGEDWRSYQIISHPHKIVVEQGPWHRRHKAPTWRPMR